MARVDDTQWATGGFAERTPLTRILYRSLSYLREDSPTLIFDLMTLIDQSIAYNARHRITGVLAFRNSAFLQVLEGPTVAVDTLYEQICRDRRHHDVRLLGRETCETRGFGQWSMAYLGYEHDLRRLFSGSVGPAPSPGLDQIVGSLAGMLV